MKKYLLILLAVLACSFFDLQAQSLEDYLELAAKNNPGLRAKYKSFEAALEKIPQVNTLPDPTFSFGYFILPVETRVGPQRARFSLTQMFPWFGTLKSKEDAATLLAEARYQAFLDARNKLYFQVAVAYHMLYELRQWIELEKRNVEILNSYKTISTKQFENGNGAMVDVLRVDIMLKDATTNLQILTTKQVPLLTAFNSLLNRDANEEVVMQDSIFIEVLPRDYRKDSLLADNPILNELEFKRKASAEMEQLATQQGLPTLGIGLDYTIVGNRSGVELPDNGKDILMPMVSVSIPIFRRKYNAAINEAKLSQDSYQLQREDHINSLISGYETVIFELEQQRQLIELYDVQITESKQVLSLLYTAYGNSGKDFEEVLTMQKQILKYEKMKVTAIAKYSTAMANLDYLTAKQW